MKINLKQLHDLDACAGGVERFISQVGNSGADVDVCDLIGGANTVSDLLWLAGKLVSKTKIVRFACDCALLNIEFIRPYTNDFNLIVDFLRNPDHDAAAAHAAARADAARAAARADAAAARAAAARAAAAEMGDKINGLLRELFKDES